MSENTNLTTTITSEEYKQIIYRLNDADRLAETVAADWLASVGFGFNKPSDATLEALKRFDHELYFDTKKKVEEAEAKAAEIINKAVDRLEKAEPHVCPYLSPDGPGVPLREIKIGDNPGADPQITCKADGTIKPGTGNSIPAMLKTEE